MRKLSDRRSDAEQLPGLLLPSSSTASHNISTSEPPDKANNRIWPAFVSSVFVCAAHWDK
jgi:hypothetical protein